MWKLTDGCVILLVTGKNPERFLNGLRKRGIPVRAASMEERGRLRLSIPAKDFLRIRPVARACGCRVHILERRGFAFWLRALLKRPGLWGGALAGLALMALMSTRILFIRITGNERIPDAVILRALAGEGVCRFGGKPKGTTLIEIAQNARVYDDRIAWLGLRMRGMTLSVKVQEMTPDIPRLDGETDCHVVAVKDGQVTDLRVYEGRALVEENAYVKAGDILISGAFLADTSKVDQLEIPMRVHARGEVTALVTYEAKFVADGETEAQTDTGNTAPYQALSLLGRMFLAGKAPFSDWEVRDTKSIRLTDFFLPVEWITGTYYETCLTPRPLTEAEQTETALYEAELLAMLKVPDDAALLSKETRLTRENGCIAAIVTVVTRESIGLEKEMDP